MIEGVNMGRQCPWKKDELEWLYTTLESYTKYLTLRLLKEEGERSAKEAFASYNMFKFPVVYVYIHYHYGKFEDIGMKQSDISMYITMYMMMAKETTQGILEGLQTTDVFYYDESKKISTLLEKICVEVLYILNH